MKASIQYAVGLNLRGRTCHEIVDADDALVAALRVKAQHPDALITYVRRANRRGDARHPPPALES
jgi:hypothetical protein